MRPTEKEIEEKWESLRGRMTPPYGNVSKDFVNWAMDRATEGMMPIPEAVGYEEWNKAEPCIDSKWLDDTSNAEIQRMFHFCWIDAQAALIASGRFIEIPKVEDWPDEAVSIEVRFLDDSELHVTTIVQIDRPVPAWTPKPNDPVFYRLDSSLAMVGLCVESRIDGYVKITTIDGNMVLPHKNHVKPFDASKLGKKWEEV